MALLAFVTFVVRRIRISFSFSCLHSLLALLCPHRHAPFFLPHQPCPPPSPHLSSDICLPTLPHPTLMMARPQAAACTVSSLPGGEGRVHVECAPGRLPIHHLRHGIRCSIASVPVPPELRSASPLIALLISSFARVHVHVHVHASRLRFLLLQSYIL